MESGKLRGKQQALAMAKKQTLVSPRITLLEQALTSGDTTALETFWQEAIERGTPLMESIEGTTNIPWSRLCGVAGEAHKTSLYLLARQAGITRRTTR